MKRFALIGILMLAACLIIPGSALAYENQISGHLGAGTGSFDFSGMGPFSGKGDTSMGFFGFNYSRYFTALETSDSPYFLREFLQHPTTLGVNIDSMAMTFEYDSGVELEMTMTTTELGGTYFFGSGTGVSLALVSDVDDMSVSGFKEEDASTSFMLGAEHYVTDTIAVGASYQTGSGEHTETGSAATDFDTSEVSLTVGAFVGDAVFLEAEYLSGSDEPEGGTSTDTTELSLTAMYFLNQSLGIYAMYSTETEDDGGSEDEMTMNIIGANYFFNESAYIDGSLMMMKNEMASGGEFDATSIIIKAGILF